MKFFPTTSFLQQVYRVLKTNEFKTKITIVDASLRAFSFCQNWPARPVSLSVCKENETM